MTATIVAADPQGAAQVGQSITEQLNWESTRDGVWTGGTRWERCNEAAPDGAGRCTRPAGHSLTWNHIAANADHPNQNRGIITAVWPAAPADPHANSVLAGNRVRDHGDYNNVITGIWTRNEYTWCAQTGPGGRACSRPIGHPNHWQHIAASLNEDTGRASVDEVWGGSAVPLPPGLAADPFGSVAVGASTADHPGFAEGDGFWVNDGDSAQWCGQSNPDGSRGICSRRPGHPAHWKHIASGRRLVINVWGGELATFNDPFASVGRHAWLSDHSDWNDPTVGMRVNRDNYCMITHEGNPCTRAREHYGKHIATNSDRVIDTWPNDKIWTADAAPALMDPEDGTPRDAETTVVAETPTVGTVVRLRDRKNRLYVLRERTGSAEIEVLDLTRDDPDHPELNLPMFRAVPLDRCIAQPDPLTSDELTRVAVWYHEHRESVRRIAVREYRKDRWCMAGLNQNLAALGLEQYEPKLSGLINVTLPFEHEDVKATQSVVEALVTAALADPQVVIALRMALPTIEGIELDPTGMKVSANNFSRK